MTVSVLSRLAEISVQSSLLISVVLSLRAAYGERLDKRLRYYLWLPVITRLLLPFSVGSRFSVMNLFSTAAHIGTAETPVLSGASSLTEGFARSAALTDQHTIYASFPLETVVLCVWLAGAVFVGSFALRGNTRFFGRLKKDRKEADIEVISALCVQMVIKRVPKIYISDKAASPCAVGIFCPAIYLPSWSVSDGGQLRYILMHELTHIKRRDNLLSLFFSVCCAVYWFDPLVWLMAFSTRRDRELACDAWVTGGMDPSEKTAYGMALISAVRMQSGRHRSVYAPAFAARKNEMLDRIKAIKSNRQAGKRLTIFICAVMLCALAAFGTSARTPETDSGLSMNNSGSSSDSADDAALPELCGNDPAYIKPVPLGTVKACDSDTARQLKDTFLRSGVWMELEPFSDSYGNILYFDSRINTASGEDVLTSGRSYKVIETTGAGHRIYIIGGNDVQRFGDSLYAHVRGL